ncbi:MAG: hypothetical protein ACRCTJ_03980 [Brevinema sp.]
MENILMINTLYQNKAEIIGHFKKIDSLRVNTTGYSIYRFVIEIPEINEENNKKFKQQIPCIIFGEKAEEIDKSLRLGKLKEHDIIRVMGSQQSKLEYNNKLSCYIKVSHFELIEGSTFFESIHGQKSTSDIMSSQELLFETTNPVKNTL